MHCHLDTLFIIIIMKFILKGTHLHQNGENKENDHNALRQSHAWVMFIE